ncbi:MAG: hypothetical protein KTR22_07465 [Flavobacteriaceae bacterium]|nr:hypothetical protein [Flavobacteriaceae bacterium]
MADYNLQDNDRRPITFANNDDYEIEVAFTKWRNRRSPIEKMTFDFITSDNGNVYQMLYAKKIDSSSFDSGVKYHLVLVIQELDSTANPDDQLLEEFEIDLNSNEEMRRVTVRYTLSELAIPENQMTQAKYQQIWENSPQLGDDGGIPDTNNGGIIIKT